MPNTATSPEVNAVFTNGGAIFDRNRKFGIELECYGVHPDRVAEGLRGVGVECAVEGYNHNRRTHWKIVSDISIRGENPFELVSPPLKGDAGLAEIRKVCAVLNTLRVKVNKSTGFHVHHDAADLSVDDLKAALTFYWKYEDVIQYFLPPSRRNNHFAAPCMPRSGQCGYNWIAGSDPVRSWKVALDPIRSREQLCRFQQNGGRYSAVNFDALNRHGTVEFRQHSGTTDSGKIIAWIALTQWAITRGKAMGCRIAARMVGRWAEKTMFFWKAIGWINLSDAVVIAAKNTLSERFKFFKGETAEGAPVNRMGPNGRPVQTAAASEPELGEDTPPRRAL